MANAHFSYLKPALTLLAARAAANGRLKSKYKEPSGKESPDYLLFQARFMEVFDGGYTFKSDGALEEFILTVYAVALACADVDRIVKEEEEAIEQFIRDFAKKRLTNRTIAAMDKLLDKPPSFKDAIKRVQALDPLLWPALDPVVHLVIAADKRQSREEKEVWEKWLAFKATWPAPAAPAG
ncbi:MAG: hypothetical protein G8345_06150 [Magnetococcales bacterium]|nr:hypothetical protein [Magnetococcales bacterium]NGZ26451.1 hypothetical protein [Magnetococcales bacterium]